MTPKTKIIKNIFSFITPISTFFVLSSTAFAATGSCDMSGMKTIKDIIEQFIVGCILYNSMYLFMSISVVIFLWGVFNFVRTESDEKKQAGREFMVWGIVGLFVMVSIWGIVSVFQGTLNLGGDFNITPKTVDISNF